MTEIRVHRYGNAVGKPIVLLHPGGMFHSVWRPIIRGWQHEYAIFAADLPPSRAIADLSQGLEGLLQERCDGPLWLIGASLGANVALHLATNSSLHIAGLILDSAQAGGPTPVALRRVVNGLALASPFVPKPLIARLLMRAFQRYEIDDRLAIHAEIRSLGLAGLLGHIAAHFNYDVRDRLPHLAIPTLLLAGSRDWLTKSGEPQRLHAAIPQSTLIIVPNAGHPTLVSNPDVVLGHATAFLPPA